MLSPLLQHMKIFLVQHDLNCLCEITALVSEVSQSDSSELSFLSPSLSLLMEVSGIILTFHHSFIWTYHSSIIQQQVRYQLLHPMAHTFLMMWLSTVTF